MHHGTSLLPATALTKCLSHPALFTKLIGINCCVFRYPPRLTSDQVRWKTAGYALGTPRALTPQASAWSSTTQVMKTTPTAPSAVHYINNPFYTYCSLDQGSVELSSKLEITYHVCSIVFWNICLLWSFVSFICTHLTGLPWALNISLLTCTISEGPLIKYPLLPEMCSRCASKEKAVTIWRRKLSGLDLPVSNISIFIIIYKRRDAPTWWC